MELKLLGNLTDWISNLELDLDVSDLDFYISPTVSEIWNSPLTNFLLLLILILLWITFGIDHHYLMDMENRAVRVSKLSQVPITPAWTLNPDLERYLGSMKSGVRIEILIDPKQNRWSKWLQMAWNWQSVFFHKTAQCWVERTLQKTIDTTSRLTKDPCVVWIPSSNFKCKWNKEKDGLEFLPKGGLTPGSVFFWQMCGEGNIQITYHLDNTNQIQIAGWCIYLSEPYTSQNWYHRSHLRFKRQILVPKRILRDSQGRIKLDKTLCLFRKSCQIVQVVIGEINGETNHFEEVPGMDAFLATYCKKCKDTKVQKYEDGSFVEVESGEQSEDKTKSEAS